MKPLVFVSAAVLVLVLIGWAGINDALDGYALGRRYDGEDFGMFLLDMVAPVTAWLWAAYVVKRYASRPS